MSKRERSPRAQSKSIDPQQQAARASFGGQGGLIADAHVIRGAGTKHGRGRKQWGPAEFAQEALHKIPNRDKLSTRQLTAAVNDRLVREPKFRARFGKDRKIHRRTVERAQKALSTLDH